VPANSLEQEGNQLILHTDGIICSTTRELTASDAFEYVVKGYVRSLQKHDSPILQELKAEGEETVSVQRLIALLRTLAVVPLEQVVKLLPNTDVYLDRQKALLEWVEGLYNFWRSHGRYMVCHSEQGPNSHDQRPYRTFGATTEQLSHLVRSLYRDICENITGDHPRVYRQVSAGCEVGIIATETAWNCPDKYRSLLEGIPLIRQVLINPPLILNPPMNTRTGQFREVDENPLLGLNLEKEKWLCYPAQVGPIVVFT
jgi:hypothetical protein